MVGRPRPRRLGLDLPGQQGVDGVQPVVQVSVAGGLHQVTSVGGDDTEGVRHLHTPRGWSGTVVFCPRSGEVHQSPLTRVPLISEDEDVGPTHDNPPLLPALGFLLQDVQISFLGAAGGDSDLLDVGEDAGGGGGRGGGGVRH